jgi:hypothetical protein
MQIKTKLFLCKLFLTGMHYIIILMWKLYLDQWSYLNTDNKRKVKLWRPIGLWDIELSHFLDNRFTDGGKVVSPTRQPPFTPQEDSWYSFLLEAE